MYVNKTEQRTEMNKQRKSRIFELGDERVFHRFTAILQLGTRMRGEHLTVIMAMDSTRVCAGRPGIHGQLQKFYKFTMIIRSI